MTALCMAALLSAQSTQADPIVVVIKAAVKKVIKAIDLRIQRLQNEQIRLQNAQKAIENALSKVKLKEISEWVEKQRKQYAVYYEELWKVKAAITYYHEIKAIIQKQKDLVDEYKRAYELFRKDGHFKADEISYMSDIYEGILVESLHNVDQILLVVNSFKTQMTDAKRLELIGQAAARIDDNLVDLRTFNNSNVLISIQRSKDQAEITAVRKYYGIE